MPAEEAGFKSKRLTWSRFKQPFRSKSDDSVFSKN
jgi:hypothetical protein